MALKRANAKKMREAGFLPFEIREFSQAKDPSGEPQDTDKICKSEPFKEMLGSRREWWRQALGPKSDGGWGLTYAQGKKAIENHYKQTKRRKKTRSIWDFLKTAYRPKGRIVTKRDFTDAVIAKSQIVRDMGPYGKSLKHKQMQLPSKKCSVCRGTGNLMGIDGRNNLCIRCGGTGLSARKKYF